MDRFRKLNEWIAGHFRAIDDEQGALSRSGPPGGRAALVLIVSALTLVALQYIVIGNRNMRAVFPPWVAEQLPGDDPVRFRIGWALGCVLFYLIIPAIFIRLVLRERLRDYGLTFKGFFRHAPIYLLMFLPVGAMVVLVSYDPHFQATYPFYKNPSSLMHLLAWELCYAMQFVALEFFFRGFMLHGLKKRYGTSAIWIMVIPYCMIHFPKPWPETCGALVAGTVLGVLSLRTGSVMGGAAIHIAVAWWMDILSLWQKSQLGALF
ncbi:MAG: hypothetical protein CMH54_04550 [Myxococcales bacterium]|nr:hypothetical protein [Myxococcales bacterium]